MNHPGLNTFSELKEGFRQNNKVLEESSNYNDVEKGNNYFILRLKQFIINNM